MPAAPVRRYLIALAVALSLVAFGPHTEAAALDRGRVTSFSLIDAETGQRLSGFDPIAFGATVDLAELPTRNVDIVANTIGSVDRVRIKVDQGPARVDFSPPYVAFGGSGSGQLQPGDHFAIGSVLADGRRTRPAAVRFTVVDSQVAVAAPSADDRAPSPSPSPSEEASASPTPAPAAPSDQPVEIAAVNEGGTPCGRIPDAPAGWERRVRSTFSETTALGAWPGPVAAQDWRSRPDGSRDSSGRGIYDSSKTVSEHDGLLDIWIHSEGERRYVAAPIPTIGDTVGQRISMCMRADRIPGYKLAFLLWPDQGPGNHHGEIDFPEGKLTPTGTAHAFVHFDPKAVGENQRDAYDSGTSTVDWHQYVLEWDPGSAGSQTDDQVAFYLDGRLVGRTTGVAVPDGPMHYVMQIETYLAGQPLPDHAQGHVLVDWVTIDVPK